MAEIGERNDQSMDLDTEQYMWEGMSTQMELCTRAKQCVKPVEHSGPL
jgi:hypothetical protein